MKIALIKRNFSLQAGGSEKYAVALAEGLQKAGHTIKILCNKIDHDLKQNVNYQKIPISKISSATKNKSFAVNAGHAIQNGNFDIAYGLGRAHHLDVVRVTERIQSHWIKVNYEKTYHLQKWNPRHKTLIQLEKEIYTANKTRRIVVQSLFDQKILAEQYQLPKLKFTHIPNGVNAEKFFPQPVSETNKLRQNFKIENNAKILLFVSNDFKGKGLSTILQVISRLKSNEKPLNLKLLVVGNDSNQKFQRQANHLNISKQIIFAGRQTNLATFYSAADLLVHPTKYEPMPNVVLESLACSTPAITTPNNGSADLIQYGTNGYIISSAKAVDELAGSIQNYFQRSSAEQAQMKQNARTSILKHSQTENFKKTEQLLTELFKKKQTTSLVKTH